jgi:hypothetical protein
MRGAAGHDLEPNGARLNHPWHPVSTSIYMSVVKLRDVTHPLTRNMRLTLDYPLTRPFPSTALAPLAYAAGVLALGILAILNSESSV